MNKKDNLNHEFLNLRPVQASKSTFLGVMSGNIRLRLFFLAGLFAFIVFTGLFLFFENRLSLAFEKSVEADLVSVLTGNLKLNIANARSAEKSFLISKERDFAKGFYDQLVSLSELLNQLSKNPEIASQQKNLDTIRDGLAQYDAKFSILLGIKDPQGPKGRDLLGRELQAAADKAQQFDELLLYLSPSITSVVEYSKNLQKSRRKDFYSVQYLYRVVIVCGGAFLFGILTLIGLIVIRSFLIPMRELAATASRLAKDNNLGNLPEITNLNPTGEIARALEHWQETLSDLLVVRQELLETQKLIKAASQQEEIAKEIPEELVHVEFFSQEKKGSISSRPEAEPSMHNLSTSLSNDSISVASQQLANFSQFVNVSANDVERTGALIKGLDNTKQQMEKMSTLIITIRDQTNFLTRRSVPKYSNSANMVFHSNEGSKITKNPSYNESDIFQYVDVIRDSTQQVEEINISIRKNLADVTSIARGIAITASEQAIEATTKLLSQSEHLQNLLGDLISKVKPSRIAGSKTKDAAAGEPKDS
jgi:hypothetical protein